MEESMRQKNVDTMSPVADDVVRRRSLLILGGVAAASAAAGSSRVHAGKVAKKARKRSRKTCRRQVDQCRNVMADFCAREELDCPDNVLEAALACCSPLSTCKAGQALDCFFAT
jgi:hypothetical protein